jgi:hypothetical protein
VCHIGADGRTAVHQLTEFAAVGAERTAHLPCARLTWRIGKPRHESTKCILGFAQMDSSPHRIARTRRRRSTARCRSPFRVRSAAR